MIKKVFKAIATVTVVSILTRLMSFVFRVYLSRKLGAEILGVYQIATSIFMLFVCFSSSGLPVTLSRKTAQYEALGDIAKSRKIFSTALICSMAISVFFCTLFALFPDILNMLFTDKRCIDIFIILLPSLISTSVYCITRAWFWGKKDFTVYSVTELLEETLKIIFTSSFILFPVYAASDAANVALAYVIGDFVCAAILLILYFRKGGRITRPGHLKEVAISAAPLTSTRIFASIVSSATALILPMLLVNTGMDTGAATAEYGRMSGMVMPLLLAPTTIVGSLAVVIVPELAENSHANDKMRRQISNSFIFAAGIACIFVSIYYSAGKEIGVLLYHDEKAGELLALSAALMIPLSMGQLASTVLNSLGKESWTFIVHIIGSVVLLTLIAVLPPYVGIMAYPIGLIAFHSATLILNTVKIRKTTKVGLSYLLDCGIMLIICLLAIFAGKSVSHAMQTAEPIANISVTTCVTVSIFGLLFAAAYLYIYLKKRGDKKNF